MSAPRTNSRCSWTGSCRATTSRSAPKEAIGKNTAACLQSGLVFGYVGLVEGLVTRLRQELPGAKTIATGGLASTMAPLTKSLDTLDDALTLQGLRLLWELNR